MNKPYRFPANPNAPNPTTSVPLTGPTLPGGMGSDGDKIPDHAPVIPRPAPDNGPKPYKF